MCFDQIKNFCFIKNMQKMSGYPNTSSFVIAVPLPFSSLLNSKHKNAFIWVCWHFWHMLDKTKVSGMVNIHILYFYLCKWGVGGGVASVSYSPTDSFFIRGAYAPPPVLNQPVHMPTMPHGFTLLCTNQI